MSAIETSYATRPKIATAMPARTNLRTQGKLTASGNIAARSMISEDGYDAVKVAREMALLPYAKRVASTRTGGRGRDGGQRVRGARRERVAEPLAHVGDARIDRRELRHLLPRPVVGGRQVVDLGPHEDLAQVHRR